mmetsp:Transcript_16336/g.41344  ORF Transcript_16336/g.41344 Transcript_16336/m.41344 type:complete len:228 (+) Transcript_16336:282-965(+)
MDVSRTHFTSEAVVVRSRAALLSRILRHLRASCAEISHSRIWASLEDSLLGLHTVSLTRPTVTEHRMLSIRGAAPAHPHIRPPTLRHKLLGVNHPTAASTFLARPVASSQTDARRPSARVPSAAPPRPSSMAAPLLWAQPVLCSRHHQCRRELHSRLRTCRARPCRTTRGRHRRGETHRTSRPLRTRMRQSERRPATPRAHSTWSCRRSGGPASESLSYRAPPSARA